MLDPIFVDLSQSKFTVRFLPAEPFVVAVRIHRFEDRNYKCGKEKQPFKANNEWRGDCIFCQAQSEIYKKEGVTQYFKSLRPIERYYYHCGMENSPAKIFPVGRELQSIIFQSSGPLVYQTAHDLNVQTAGIRWPSYAKSHLGPLIKIDDELWEKWINSIPEATLKLTNLLKTFEFNKEIIKDVLIEANLLATTKIKFRNIDSPWNSA